MIDAADPNPICLKHKVISALFPYVVQQEQEGQHEMLNTFLHVARVSAQDGFIWHHAEPLVATLLHEGSSISLKQVVLLASPHMAWWKFRNGEHLVQQWAVATSTVPYTDDIGRSVVDTLLQVAYLDTLRPHIPVGMWSWLNKQPYLYPVCWGRCHGTHQDVVQIIQPLKVIEILKSYFLLVWSEWDGLWPEGLSLMCTLIQEDFSGARMKGHRQDLLQHLDYILGRLDLGLGYLQQYKISLDEGIIEKTKGDYTELKQVLLEVNEQVGTP